MSGLPVPMADSSLNVQGYDYMPLLGARLFASDFYALAVRNPRGGIAGQKLWWTAWQQVPAGSLPANEYSLCTFADFGSDMRSWKRAREVAMHGFILCSDGRYYHPLIVELARKALDIRAKARDKKARQRANHAADERQNAADLREHAANPATDTQHQPIDNAGFASQCPQGRPGSVPAEGKVREGKEEDTSLRSVIGAAQSLPLPTQDARATIVPLSAAAPSDLLGQAPSTEPRGSRLPKDWQPSTADVAYAEGFGLVAAAVALDFRGYWHTKPGKDGRKLDWSLTWQGWCRRQAERNASRGKPRPPSAPSAAQREVPLDVAGRNVQAVVAFCENITEVHYDGLWGKYGSQQEFSLLIADALAAGLLPENEIKAAMRDAARHRDKVNLGPMWFRKVLGLSPDLRVVA